MAQWFGQLTHGRLFVVSIPRQCIVFPDSVFIERKHFSATRLRQGFVVVAKSALRFLPVRIQL